MHNAIFELFRYPYNFLYTAVLRVPTWFSLLWRDAANTHINCELVTRMAPYTLF